MLSLLLTKGPLSEKLIQDISHLYGKYSHQYASPDFCSYLFNQNPFGYSYHAFIMDDGNKAVGHYGMIPINAFTQEKKVPSVKGEAFVVHEDFRSYTVVYNGRETPVALALSLSLTAFVFSEGIELVHAICPKNIALLHQRAGCKEQTIDELFFYFFNHSIGSSWKKKWLTGCCSLLQSCLFKLFSPVLWLQPIECVPVHHLNDVDFQRLFLTIEQQFACKGQWSIDARQETLKWLLKTATLSIVYNRKNRDEFALIRKCLTLGHPIEIVAWKSQSSCSLSSMALFAAIVKESRTMQSPFIKFSTVIGDFSALQVTARFFGSIARLYSTSLYVKAVDSFYTNKNNIKFSPWFYATF